MRTIIIIGGIILAGATVIAVVQNDRKNDTAPQIQQVADPQSQPVQPSMTPATNPAHGIAGHRCDLAVGAPLTTASGSATPAQKPPTINMNPSSVPAPAGASGPASGGIKINPAHGMPGHRCDIQVGAPLT